MKKPTRLMTSQYPAVAKPANQSWHLGSSFLPTVSEGVYDAAAPPLMVGLLSRLTKIFCPHSRKLKFTTAHLTFV